MCMTLAHHTARLIHLKNESITSQLVVEINCNIYKKIAKEKKGNGQFHGNGITIHIIFVHIFTFSEVEHVDIREISISYDKTTQSI